MLPDILDPPLLVDPWSLEFVEVFVTPAVAGGIFARWDAGVDDAPEYDRGFDIVFVVGAV